MPVEVILPKVDMDMATGKIAKWHVKEGDTVKQGSALFEIETDKAAMEVDSPAGGIIHGISAAEGAVVPVGVAVAYIYAEGEVVGPRDAAVQAAGIPDTLPPSSPASDVEAILSPGPGLSRATPLARRLAREAEIALDGIAGSGPRGRVLAADVRNRLDTGKPDVAVTRQYPSGTYDMVPVDAMRRTIAQRLTLSTQTVPHFYLTVTCNLEKLEILRQNLRPNWKLSINDFVIKAMALALRQVPDANVTWADESILRHRTSDVGVAVAVDGGLFTPVVRTAESKTLSQISAEMKDLASRARARKLQPHEYQGGTTTISNLGMYGVEQFTAIINPPHATILAVGAAIERFMPVDGLPVLRKQMTCTLSCDHRAVDGATGAQLLASFRSFIEEPALMLA